MRNKIIILLIALVLTVTSVNAAAQSRPGVYPIRSLSPSDFFKFAREMEMVGGALGKEATFADVNGAYIETSTSNDVDAHMCKNTEWGVVAMLSASPYGAGNGKVKYTHTDYVYDITASTTGNMTGVFGMSAGMASHEYMAAVVKEKIPEDYYKRYATYIINASARHMDDYKIDQTTGDVKYIPGDATDEVSTFGASRTKLTPPIVYRGKSSSSNTESIFAVYSHVGWDSSYYGGRIVVWCGKGL